MLKRKIKQWLQREDGASAVEYALICSAAILVFGAAYVLLADILLNFFTNFIGDINPF